MTLSMLAACASPVDEVPPIDNLATGSAPLATAELMFPRSPGAIGTALPESNGAAGFRDFTNADYEGAGDGDGVNERMRWAADPLGSGRTVAQFEVYGSDSADIYGGTRAELWKTPRDNCNGCEGWFAFSWYLPASFMYSDQWLLIMQNHGGAGNPPQAVSLEDLDHDGVRDELNFWTQTAPSSGRRTHNIGNATRGVWHYFVAYIRFSLNNDGIVRAWHREGAPPDTSMPPIFQETGLDTLYDGYPSGGMAKIGLYRGASTGTQHQLAYLGGYGRAATAARAFELAGFGGSPPPPPPPSDSGTPVADGGTGSGSTTLRLTASDDTFVDSATPTTAHGSGAQLDVDNAPSSKQTLLRFSVAGLPAGATVTSATLQLYVVGSSVQAGYVHRVSGSWSEATTWNTRPAAGTRIAALPSPATAGTWRVVGVTPVVTGNGVFDFYVLTDSEDGAHYASSEATVNRPQLVVTATW